MEGPQKRLGGKRLPPVPPHAREHCGADDIVYLKAGEYLIENFDGERREKVRHHPVAASPPASNHGFRRGSDSAIFSPTYDCTLEEME